MRGILLVVIAALLLATTLMHSLAGDTYEGLGSRLGAMSSTDASQVRTAIAHCKMIAANPTVYGDPPDSCVKLLQLFNSLKDAATK
jgi:hypothetical protein